MEKNQSSSKKKKTSSEGIDGLPYTQRIILRIAEKFSYYEKQADAYSRAYVKSTKRSDRETALLYQYKADVYREVIDILDKEI